MKEAYRVLKSPHITEKAEELSKINQYVFKVESSANKNSVKKAVKEVFKVDVVSVKMINVVGKKIRVGKTQGETKGYKKAIVRVKEGQKIEVMPR